MEKEGRGQIGTLYRILQKERLPKDARYQEFREITLDCRKMWRSRVISLSAARESYMQKREKCRIFFKICKITG